MHFIPAMTTLNRTALTSLALGLVCLAAAPVRADDGADEKRRKREMRRTPVVTAVEHSAPSVVSIGTTRLMRVRRFWEWDFIVQERPGALGSGVIVHPRGYVITNAHVINQAAQIAVKLTGMGDDREIPAELLAVDLEHDLALLRMSEPGPYPVADFGSSDDLMVGETVIALGSPFGLGRTVTTGVISALKRDVRIRDQSFEGLIQTDAAVNQGNSGGALLNIVGELIGVNSAIFSLSGGYDGISFAIPVATVREFLVEAMRPRRIAGRWLGVEFEEGPGGRLQIGTVYPVSPAAKLELERGMLVTDADGKPRRDLVTLTFEVLDAVESGAYELYTRRADGTKKTSIPFDALPTHKLAWERLGLTLLEVTPDITEKTGYRERAGLVVQKVRADSPAARVGFERGDLITHMDESALRSLEDVLVGVQLTPAGEALEMQFVRPQRTKSGVSYERWKARLVTD